MLTLTLLKLIEIYQEKNKADLNLDKLDCQSGKITRKVFMQKVKEGVKVNILLGNCKIIT